MREKENISKNGKKPPAFEAKEVRLEHIFPQGLRSVFANHITVQHSSDGEFTISFFEIDHPVLLGDPQEIESQVAAIESVQAHCVARVAISEKRMPKVIGALARNYESFLTAKDNPDSKKGKKHAS